MKPDPEEETETKLFEGEYLRAQSPVLLAIERGVCGCDYGSTSWTTVDEARRIIPLLGLRPGQRLLDIGAGSGWPGLYLAGQSGCDIALVDLPLAGLVIAAERAASDRLAGACHVAVSDAAALPFRDGCFDAISHSDVLCCLKKKRVVLENCRRAIRDGGRMAFTVIYVAPNLSRGDHERAVEFGPTFVESETDYPTLLGQTGWTILERQDVTQDFAASIRRQIRCDEERGSALEELLGVPEFAERLARRRSKLTVIEQGLQPRELFVAAPEPA